MSVTGMGQAVSTSYCMFSLFAFLNAVGLASTFPLAFIIGKYSSVDIFSQENLYLYKTVMCDGDFFNCIGEMMKCTITKKNY